jgi:hypothetical protein
MDITKLANSIWDIIWAYLPSIATNDIEGLIGQTGGVLWKAIKKKMGTDATASEILTNLLKHPDDKDLQATFQTQLQKLLEKDSVFADNVTKILKDAGGTYFPSTDGDSAVVQADRVITSGDHGKISKDVSTEAEDFIAGDKNLGSRRLPGDATTDAPPPPKKKKNK